ncbi:MATE family efflux transporter [Cellvibrio sp. ARAG 10.3]|uniref:MATE family efflux transporter n=1 Tax=Cellvibrio sp. ARAG 10.3 TaxID=3451358 RepID=UPI003F48EA42
MTQASSDRILSGAIVPTFFYFVIPSIAALLALTTANLVDGLFIGNFVGADALAAINFLIPYLALVFGLALMLAIGGSVRAGKALGEKNPQAASAIFSKCVMTVGVFALVMASVNLLFSRWIFTALGAPESLHPLMRDYFHIIACFLPAQLLSVVLYYFIRADGKPVMATVALTSGALGNMLLDALFIGYFQWGIAGAAWATGMSQLVQLGILFRYFWLPARRLQFRFRQTQWVDVAHAAFNGISEFVNEISGGLVILVVNWLLVTRIGVEGVSAFTVINYCLFASLMIFYGIADAMQLLVAQNFGARQVQRMRQFMLTSTVAILVFGVLLISVLLGWRAHWVGWFVSAQDTAVITLAADFILVVWPIFLVNGLNVLLSSYLTAIHQPAASAAIALLRSLILPVSVLMVLFWWLPAYPLLMALPLAEWLTFVVALALFLRFKPAVLFASEQPR